jgi:hypothetical protein
MLQIVQDEVDFNNQITGLIKERNKVISEALDLMQEELKKWEKI